VRRKENKEEDREQEQAMVMAHIYQTNERKEGIKG